MATASAEKNGEVEDVMSLSDATSLLEKLDVSNVLHQLPNVAPCTELNKFFGHMIQLYEEQNNEFHKRLKIYFSKTSDVLQQEAEILRLGERLYAFQRSLKKLQNLLFQERKRAEKYKYLYELTKAITHIKEKRLHQTVSSVLESIKDGKLRDTLRLTIEPVSNLTINLAPTGDETSVKQVFESHLESRKEVEKSLDKALGDEHVDLRLLESQKEEIAKLNEIHEKEMNAAIKAHELAVKELQAKNRADVDKIATLVEKLKKAEEEIAALCDMMLCERVDLKRERVMYCVKSCIMHKCIEDLIHCALTSGVDIEPLNQISQVSKMTADLQEVVHSDEPSKLLDEIYEMMKAVRVLESSPADSTHPSASALPPEVAAASESVLMGPVDQLKDARKMVSKQRGAHKAFYEAYLKSKGELEFERQHRDAYIEPFRKQNEKLIEQMKLWQNRYDRVYNHERMKNEGLRTDMLTISQNMKKLQKTILKDMLMRNREPQEDMLKAIHKTTKGNLEAARQINRLKKKLYQVENNMMKL